MSGRCASCNEKLTRSEMCRKHAVTKEYFNLCNNCLKEVVSLTPIPFTGELYIEEKDDEFEGED